MEEPDCVPELPALEVPEDEEPVEPELDEVELEVLVDDVEAEPPEDPEDFGSDTDTDALPSSYPSL